MKLAVLPFNAVEGTPPSLGRQFSNFACDTIRAATGADLNPVSYLAEIDDVDGKRAAYVNIADALLDAQWISQLFEQSEAEGAMDGLLKVSSEPMAGGSPDEESLEPETPERPNASTPNALELTLRFHKRGVEEPVFSEVWSFGLDGLFPHLHRLVKELAIFAEVELPEDLSGETMDFGTENPEAFLKFLEGYDALMYINQSQGRVAREFSPEPAVESLLAAVQADPDFLGPYETVIQLCRQLVSHRIGTFEVVEQALRRVSELVPDDFRAWFALGEGYQAVGDPAKAAEAYEKALAIEPNESSLYTRLGLAQMGMNMPVNAERNFRKAVEMEDEEKPSLDYLAMVLAGTGRSHEVPGLWKEQVERNPAHGLARAKHAISLMQAGREQEGVEAFEKGLAEVEDNLAIKRFFAPVLHAQKELDRAMDLFEDVIEASPNDVQILLEYANVLKDADREFEIPNVLRDVLSSNPDPNTRAQTLAWMLEIQEPRRTEAVEEARKKLEEGNFDEAIRELKPLRNWLADYWKMWAMLAAAHNKLEQWEDAEDACKRLIELFPGCEPGYGELVTALHGMKRDEEAYNLMRWAASNMPQSLGIHVNLALAANRAGHGDEASALAKQIREAVGPNDELDLVLAEIDR